jgi:hypothetical protein
VYKQFASQYSQWYLMIDSMQSQKASPRLIPNTIEKLVTKCTALTGSID